MQNNDILCVLYGKSFLIFCFKRKSTHNKWNLVGSFQLYFLSRKRTAFDSRCNTNNIVTDLADIQVHISLILEGTTGFWQVKRVS